MKTLKLFLFSLLFIFFACGKKNEKNQEAIFESSSKESKYYYSVANSLNLREQPSLTSKVLAFIKECEKVKFLEDSKISAVVNGHPANFYRVKTNKNIIGFVYSSYLEVYIDKKAQPNKEKFQIYGEWPMYYDAPNYSYIFNTDGSIEEAIMAIEDPEKATKEKNHIGSFEYDNCCSIKVNLDTGKNLEFKVVRVNGKPTLQLNCFIFEPDLFHPMLK